MLSASKPTKLKSALTLTLASTILGGVVAPAIAAEEKPVSRTIENLDSKKGDVVSVETSEAEAFKADPKTGVKPKTGGDHPGAVMGQSLRGEQNRTGYTPESSKAVLKEIADVTPDKKLAKNIEEKLAASDTSVENGGAAVSTWKPSGIQGMDVSGHQPVINWSSEWAKGSRFAYVKATEGTYYKSEAFGDQYTASRNVGMIRGSYHFAYPEVGTGASQADFFINNGGGWSADGKTLPGLLDVEYNPYGQICYNMSQDQMRTWIQQFSDRYKQRTGRLPAIYSTTNWWKSCTGNTTIFNDHPLHIAAYNNYGAGELFAGRSNYDIWQYSDTGPFAGDSNQFAGSTAKLNDLALNKNYVPLGGKSPAGSTTTAPKPAPAPSYPVYGAISAKWKQLGGEAGIGAPTGNEVKANGGFYQSFKKGSTTTKVFWSPSTGAQPVIDTGGIGGKFRANGYEIGVGWPTGPEKSMGGGVVTQTFKKTNGETNVIHWQSGMPTTMVKTTGTIGAYWAAKGGLSGLGYPTNDETVKPDGTNSQSFKKGSTTTTISSKGGKLIGAADGATTPPTTTAPNTNFTVKGGIQGKYRTAGGESALGKPTMNEKSDGAGGVYQEFKKGSAVTTIYWTSGSGAKIIKNTGGIGEKWISAGRSGGYGQPTTDEVSRGNGVVSQTFKKGSASTTVYWQPGVDTVAVNDNGGIAGKWRALGGLNGAGAPITDEMDRGDGIVSQSFKKGNIVTQVFWKSGVGTQSVKESTGIGGKWRAMGGYDKIGMPTGGEVSRGDGIISQSFRKGGMDTTIFWKSGSPTTAVKTTGGIGNVWNSKGGLNGLGYPTGDEVSRGNGFISQTFKKGNVSSTIYWKSGMRTVTMVESGDIYIKWRDTGGLNGYGAPITEKTQMSDGSFEQRFQKGSAVTRVVWTGQFGAHAIKENGDLGKLYLSQGGAKTWGHPTTDETNDKREVYQKFSKGKTLSWSKDINTIRVTG